MEMDFVPVLVGWLGAAIAGGVGAYFGAYLSKKGENLATKEDVKEITTSQEEVKHDFQILSDRMKATENMRMAVIERRFQAHQEAYSLWLKLFQGIHDEDNAKRVLECQTWWEQNNLYLEPEVRRTFKTACFAAHMHRALLVGARGGDSEQVTKNWKRLEIVGETIEKAVNLPSIGDLATKSPKEEVKEN